MLGRHLFGYNRLCVLFGYNQTCVSLQNKSYKLKLPTQVPSNVTGKVSPLFDVIIFDTKFDVTIFDVKTLSILCYQYYPIQSRCSRI